MKESESSGASANGPYVLHFDAQQHQYLLICLWILAGPCPQEQAEAGRLQSRIQMTVLGTARRRPWNLASFVVVCELYGLGLELGSAKCSVAFTIHDTLLSSYATYTD